MRPTRTSETPTWRFGSGLMAHPEVQEGSGVPPEGPGGV